MAPSARSQRATPREIALWSLLLLALGPAWGELLRHIRVEPWAGYALVVPPLLVWGGASAPRERGNALLGAGLLAAALVVELAALLAGPERIGRVAIPLGVLGMSALLGRPAGRFAPLALFLVPVPSAVLRLTSPGLEALWLRGGAALSALLGRPVELVGTGVVSSGGVLGLVPADGGVALAALFAALGCFAAARAGRSAAAALLRGLLLAPLAVPVQALAVLVAVPLASAGHPAAARAALDYGLPAFCVGASLVLLARRGAARGAGTGQVPAGAVG